MAPNLTLLPFLAVDALAAAREKPEGGEAANIKGGRVEVLRAVNKRPRWRCARNCERTDYTA